MTAGETAAPRLGLGPRRVRAVAGALALRAWALDALTGRPAIAPDAAPDAWSVFLGREACAAPLLRALRGTRDVPAAVRSAAAAEAQRGLGARRTALELGRAAAAQGVRLLLLKGGVELVERGVALFVVDLDLLVRPSDFDGAAALLAREGYRVQPYATVDALSACNVNVEPPPGRVQLELHWTTSRALAPLPDARFCDAVPLARAPGLFRLASAEHAWHVLTHAVLDHPEHQGRLRDAVVLAHALERCTPAERAELAERAAAHAQRAALVDALRLGERLASRAGDAWRDPFAGRAAAAYAARGALPTTMPRPLFHEAAAHTLYGVAGGAPGRAALRVAMRLDDVDGGRTARVLRGGPLARLGARAARVGVYALHLGPVAPVIACAVAARTWHALRRSAPLDPSHHHDRRPT